MNYAALIGYLVLSADEAAWSPEEVVWIYAVETVIWTVCALALLIPLVWMTLKYSRQLKQQAQQQEAESELLERQKKLLDRHEAVVSRAEAILDRLDQKNAG